MSGLVEDIESREQAIAFKYNRSRAKRHEHQDDEEQELNDMVDWRLSPRLTAAYAIS